MTDGQAGATLIANGASYVGKKGNVEWWKAQDGSWIAKTVVNGDVRLQRLPSNSCNC